MQAVRRAVLSLCLWMAAGSAVAEPAIDAVVKAIHAGDRAAAMARRQAVTDRPALVRTLFAIAERPGPLVPRREAVEMLSQIGSTSDAATGKRLMKLFADDRTPDELRRDVLGAFDSLGFDATKHGDLLLRVIESDSSGEATKIAALQRVGWIARSNPRLPATLLGVIGDEHARCAAVELATNEYARRNYDPTPLVRVFTLETTAPCVARSVARVLKTASIPVPAAPHVVATAFRLLREDTASSDVIALLAQMKQLSAEDAARYNARFQRAPNRRPDEERVAELPVAGRASTHASLAGAAPGLAAERRSIATTGTSFGQQLQPVLAILGRYPVAAVIAIYVLLAGLFTLTLYAFQPLRLVHLDEKLRRSASVKLPIVGNVTLPLSHVLGIGFLAGSPRALDAWVATYIAVARERFEAKETVRKRSTHVALPMTIGAKRIDADEVQPELRKIFAQRRAVLLIAGEGGSGKTSAAVHLARAAMAEERAERLADAYMLPVLLEQDLPVTKDNQPDQLLSEVTEQLRALLAASQVSPELVRRLLQQRRILLIVDHFSEMRDTTRAQIDPSSPDFPANALIVTSRLDEELGGAAKTMARPARVRWSDLTKFMEHYLRGRDMLELLTDKEFHEACSRLVEVAGGRDSTVLLAKLFAELAIAAKIADGELDVRDLPRSVPDLMLRYVNNINLSRQPHEPDNATVQRAAKAVAWECLRSDLTPSPAALDDVREPLGEDADEHIEYLERKLGLIELCEPTRDLVRFTLDPLAEYLAALYLVARFGQDVAAWADWMESLPPNTAKMRGFLRALLDCVADDPELELIAEAIRLRMIVLAAVA